MTKAQKSQLLQELKYLNDQFFLVRLGDPNVDFLFLESTFTAILKSSGADTYSQWVNYRDNSFKQRGIIPDWKIYLEENRKYYAETITSFLKWFYDEVSGRNARELPYQNVPVEQIKILEKEYDEHLKQLQETKSRWLALIKEHNQMLMEQLGRELPGAAEETKQQLVGVVIKNYGEAKRFAQINHQEKDNLTLAKQTVEKQEKLLAMLGLAPQQSAGLLVRSFESLDQRVPADWWFKPDPTDTPAQDLTAVLELEHQQLVSQPVSWHEKQVVAELEKQGFSQNHISLVGTAIINAQKYYQGEFKPDSPESVVKLSLAVQRLLVFTGGPELSPVAITELLTRAYDAPGQPEKRGFIRQILYSTTQKLLLTSPETNLVDFIANRQEQIQQFTEVFKTLPGKFFPDFSKLSSARLLNINQVLDRIRQMIPITTTAGKPLPLWQSLFQSVFSFSKVSFGPALSRVAGGAAGLGRTLFGWAGKGLTSLLGWGARAAAGAAAGTTVAAGASTLPVWVIALLIIVPLLFLTGFLSGPVDTAALLPAPRYDITVPGALPPGTGKSLYVQIVKSSDSSPEVENSALPHAVTYTIVVTALQGPLTNIGWTNEYSIFQEPLIATAPNPNIPNPPETILPTEPYSFQYQVVLNQDFADSSVCDTFTVNTTAPDGSSDSVIASLCITIGTPPEDCPSGWPVDISAGQEYFIGQGPFGQVTHFDDEAVDVHPAENGRYNIVTAADRIVATHRGVVTAAAVDQNGGQYVDIAGTCAGVAFRTRHVHFISISGGIKPGVMVSRGVVLGLMGQTGIAGNPHNHYEFLAAESDTALPPILMGLPFLPVPRSQIYQCASISTCKACINLACP